MIPFKGLFGANLNAGGELGYAGLTGVFNMLTAVLSWDIVRGSMVLFLGLSLVGAVILMIRGAQ
jgi:hypothetical protein